MIQTPGGANATRLFWEIDVDKQQAIYVADLIEQLLRHDDGPFMLARNAFTLTHGNHGLDVLFRAEKAIRAEWQIPDSTGKVDIAE